MRPDEPFWVAQTAGSLQVINNCFYIVADNDPSGEKWIAMWPPAYTLVSTGPPGVAHGDGAPLFVGQHATFSGGEFDAAEAGQLLDKLLGGKPRPDSCGSNHYWVVTGLDRK